MLWVSSADRLCHHLPSRSVKKKENKDSRLAGLEAGHILVSFGGGGGGSTAGNVVSKLQFDNVDFLFFTKKREAGDGPES